MANDKADKLKQKKQELQAELENIQNELDQSIDSVRSDVSSQLDPVEFIKKHPLPVVGASVVIGFLAGHKRSLGSTIGEGFSGALWYELKKLATKKAIAFTTDYVENLFLDQEETVSASENGSVKKD